MCSTTWFHHTKATSTENKCLEETSVGEIYIENSRTEPQKIKTSKENNDYYKNEVKQPDIEMSYSAIFSGTTYKHKNSLTMCSQDCLNSVKQFMIITSLWNNIKFKNFA